MEMAGNSSKEIEVDDDDNDDNNNNNDNTGVGRTYECSYCKRGFTNAQALGGHMNIHRKDKAKAKQQYPTFNNSQSSFSCSSSCSSSPIVSNYYKPDLGTPQWNYQPYYNPRSSRFASFVGSNNNNYSNDFPIVGQSSSLFGAYEERLGADLSLKINSSSTWTNYHHHQEAEENVKNSTKTKEEDYDTIDLELRLGYDRP